MPDHHDLCRELTGRRDEAPSPPPSLVIWGCEHTPCSFCRNLGIDALIESGQAPRRLLEEALHDCDKNTREAAAEALERLA